VRGTADWTGGDDGDIRVVCVCVEKKGALLDVGHVSGGVPRDCCRSRYVTICGDLKRAMLLFANSDYDLMFVGRPPA
jgi:hypothetical protein